MRSLARFVVPAVAIFGVVFAGIAGSSGQGPGQVPPDIQRILNKASSGKALTAAEQKRLEAWGKAQSAAAGNTVGQGLADARLQGTGIPCSVHVQGAYSSLETKEQVSFDFNTNCILVAQMNGKGDYFTGMLNPQVKTTILQFLPDMKGTTVDTRGTGSWSLKSDDGFIKTEIVAHVKQATFGLVLVSNGTDNLYPLPGSAISVESTGTKTTKAGDQDPVKEEVSPGEWSSMLKVPFPETVDSGWQPGTPTPTQFPAKIPYKDVSTAIAKSGQSRLAYSEQFNFTTRQGKHVKGSCTLEIVLRPSNLPELIVEITDYENWIPTGGADEQTAGNSAVVKAKLVNADRKPLEATQKATKITFELLKTSKEPGVCMNWPPKPDSQAGFDLRLDPGPNLDLQIDPTAQKGFIAGKSLDHADATVACYDFGGYTTIKVTAETPKGTITGYLSPNKSIVEIPLPKRDEGSLIATHWKELKGVTNLKDDSDEEDLPVGDKDKGDGFTLYEEYRGFREGGNHFRGDPKKKDVMVCNLSGARAQDAVSLFAGASGFEVHSKYLKQEFGADLGAGPANADPPYFQYNKVINRHVRSGPHSVDQHGVVLITSTTPRDAAEAIANGAAARGTIGTPKSCKYVLIPINLESSYDAWVKTRGPGRQQVQTDYYAATVAHELGHCVNARHHGEGDLGTCHAELANGAVQILSGAVVGRGNFFPTFTLCNDDAGGTPITTTDPRWGTQWMLQDATGRSKPGLRLVIGVEHGQHSGFEDCLMRYDNANAYRRGSNVYYLNAPPGYAAEVSGITFCTTREGVGINSASHKPRTRYGAAAADYGQFKPGDCKHQLCVNDKYH